MLVVGLEILEVTVGRCKWEPHVPCCRGTGVETDPGVVGKIHLAIPRSTQSGSPVALTICQTALQQLTHGENALHHDTWAMLSQSKIEAEHELAVGLFRTCCRMCFEVVIQKATVSEESKMPNGSCHQMVHGYALGGLM